MILKTRIQVKITEDIISLCAFYQRLSLDCQGRQIIAELTNWANKLVASEINEYEYNNEYETLSL